MAKIPHDKLLHSFYGTCIYILFSFINPLFAVLSVIIVAIAKEIYDEIIYSGFDWKDIIATIAIPMLLFIKEVKVG
jgi:hypothetical protein